MAERAETKEGEERSFDVDGGGSEKKIKERKTDNRLKGDSRGR